MASSPFASQVQNGFDNILQTANLNPPIVTQIAPIAPSVSPIPLIPITQARSLNNSKARVLHWAFLLTGIALGIMGVLFWKEYKKRQKNK